MNGYVTWCRLVESGVMDGWQHGRSFGVMDRPRYAFGGKVETITKRSLKYERKTVLNLKFISSRLMFEL